MSSVTASLGAQQCADALDRDLDVRRRTHFARVGIEVKQPLAGFDLAGFGKLHADNARITPCDAASADRRVEYGVRPPRHTMYPRTHHSTVTIGRT